MDKMEITFIKNKGFASVGYTATYPVSEAEKLIEAGFAKRTSTKNTRHLEKVDKTADGGKIQKLSKATGKGDK